LNDDDFEVFIRGIMMINAYKYHVIKIAVVMII